MSVLRHETYPGQILWVRASGGRVLAKVTKVNPKNIKLVTENGAGFNAHPSFLDTPTPSEAAAWDDSTISSSSTYQPVLGEVVKFKNGKRSGLYVILGSHGSTWRVAKLGGDKNQYIRNITPDHIERVEFELAGV